MKGGLFVFFFFSSRRRHTRWTGDWSSDVCSSDLADGAAQLDAHCATFATSAEVRAHCEATTFDPMWDAARRAALDNAARHWPSLSRRPGHRRTGAVVLPFSLD